MDGFNWMKTDFESVDLYLSHYDWRLLLLYNPSILSLSSSFISVMRTVIDLRVPRFKCMTKGTKTKRKLGYIF